MIPTTVNIDEKNLSRLDSLAETLNRSRSWMINQAIERLIEYEEWAVQEIAAGIQEVKQGEIATAKEVADTFDKWGVDAR
ncbi:MAG: ribbon-helix-helix protein, CopG family [Desulfobacterium sp.]|jgi:predicted transcriptional regulator|nr:ribbon-helix-helix protein, CopG family [Desulfobacterium sp.]